MQQAGRFLGGQAPSLITNSNKQQTQRSISIIEKPINYSYALKVHDLAIEQIYQQRRGVSCSAAKADAAPADEETKKKFGGKTKSKAEDDLKLTPRDEDFAQWYTDLLRNAQLADYGPVKGQMAIRPYGYALWESVQAYLDKRFKETGHENAYFPQLIPMSFIAKEASHIEGFAPELAVVTQGGGKELVEPLVVRPTSETMVNHMYSKWVSSWRDLPLLINQWCNVHRWEQSTRPFLRTLEFLWQEGHTAHATPEEAEEEALRMIQIYSDLAFTQAAMPVLVGQKSDFEKFAGGDVTYTIEAMMQDGRALQAGTSHNLGTNFAKAFDITFTDQEKQIKHVHQTSWGVSTRFVGGIIMTHSDDQGLRLPPNIAPIQVVIVPIWGKGDDEGVQRVCQQLRQHCLNANIRVKFDSTNDRNPGYKYNHWELRGVPIRVEVGPRDVKQNACVTARRDMHKKKDFGVPIDEEGFISHITQLMEDIQASLLKQATEYRDSRIFDVKTMEELETVVGRRDWARVGWNGTTEHEKAIKEKTGATLRCVPFDQPVDKGTCLVTGEPAKQVAVFAKAY